MANTNTGTVTITYNSNTTADIWIETTPWPDRVYPYWQPPNNPVLEFGPYPGEIRRLTEQEQPPMRGLYKVYIINLITDKVTEVGPLVATDEDAAKMKAVFSPEVKSAFVGSDTEDVMSDEFLECFDFVIENLGSVKPRIKKDAG